MATGLFNLKQVNQAISQGAWSGYIAPRWVEYLVVAGGGGGGGFYGGGGGAGGLLTGIVTVAAGASYTVTIGTGGAGATSGSARGSSGVNSVFGSISTTGGGAGGADGVTALSGGSGGGAITPQNIGSGTSGQGNAGGSGFNGSSTTSTGGGGGGAGTVGITSNASSVAGNGGAGIASAITGTVVTYAGGGGGGTGGSLAGGAGGVGGGGTGGTARTAGSDNTGGGGGGACNSTQNTGGNGGSGIVVVRYPGNVQFYTGGTVTYSNGYIVHNFTASGTLAPTTPTVVSEYQISRSLRFNLADSAYLNRTPATTTNRTTWTWSGWVKRASFGSSQVLFGAGPDASNYTIFYFSGTVSENLEIYNYTGGVTTGYAYTTSVFRDPSAWYHVVLAVDTNQATSADRTKIYVNGVLQPITISTTFASGLNTWVNTNNNHRLGSTPATGALYGGYMTEVNLIDGQALTPTSFGYVNPTTGIWSPAKYVGGYGTNGFYVNFSDNSNTTAATLGADYSGNGNNWTPNNFSVTAGAGNDSLVDSPTSYGTDTGVGGSVRGNYCTLNPLEGIPGTVYYSNGNLNVVWGSASSSSIVVGTIAVSSGKWYWEVTPVGTLANLIGVANANSSNLAKGGGNSGGYYYYDVGQRYTPTSAGGAYGATFATGDIIGVALDMDAGTITMYKNNVSQGVMDSNLSGLTVQPALQSATNGSSVEMICNFGQRAFAYTAPSGFKALCTQNLPTPTIGATSATLASKFFTPVLYTGNGATQSITVGFQPDLVWYKSRSSGTWNHGLFDSVRGTTKQLFSNSTGAEATYSGVTAFNSGGFSVGSDNGGNESGGSMVAWNWRASNATAVSNTAGSITSTVSASPTSGFSIVRYSGNATSGATVGHGLGVAPSMVIGKTLNTSGYDWPVYHVGLTDASYVVSLNLTNAQSQQTNKWNSTAPTSTVVTLGDHGTNVSGTNNQILYCFAPVAGYSAFGKYTGNGSTDGPFVHTGFRPAFLIVKNTSNTGNWNVHDSKRNQYNVVNNQLYANTTGAEFAAGDANFQADFLSNGFKVRGSGSSGNTNADTYVYMAFAESPFKYSLAR